MSKIIKNTEELNLFAKEVLNGLNSGENATVLGLYGNLGAGKTTLTQEIAKILNIEDNILSPTFVIMKIYELKGEKWKHLIHIDAYRLESSSELVSLGFNEIIKNKDNLVIIEWPERVSDIIPKHNKIFLKFLSENEREVSLEN